MFCDCCSDGGAAAAASSAKGVEVRRRVLHEADECVEEGAGSRWPRWHAEAGLEEARRRAEALGRQQQEAELASWVRRAEEARRGEAERRERIEGLFREEEAKRAEEEAERSAQEERKAAALKDFLRKHGFAGTDASKRTLLKTTYPLHCAAGSGDAWITAILLEQGADPTRKDSSRKTPIELAEKQNKNGSHSDVLRLLAEAIPTIASKP